VGSHLTRLTRAAPATSPTTKEPKDIMKLLKTVVAGKPLDAVFGYLSDFTTTTDWDPGTVTTVRRHGNGGIGTTYLNTSTFLGRTTQLTYVVDELVDQQLIQLRGQNKTVIAADTLTFRPRGVRNRGNLRRRVHLQRPIPHRRPTAQARVRTPRQPSRSRHAQGAEPTLTTVGPNSPPASSTPPANGQLRTTRHRCVRHPRQGHHGCVVITRPGFAGHDRGTPRP
jgi:hypothetical protein